MAEELMLMMGVFPLELCVVALERSRDDVQYAANWLLERGYQELDRWTKDTIAISKREQEEREMKVIVDTQLADQVFLTRYCLLSSPY